ncbi:MAG: hypothetical protein GY926_05765 [bacterium]|nr:hypothetical protein [bacterium]
MQRACTEMVGDGPKLAVRIGFSAGEPVEDSDDLFGASVNLAVRICAHAQGGQTLVSGTVKELAFGKEIRFRSRGADRPFLAIPPRLPERWCIR